VILTPRVMQGPEQNAPVVSLLVALGVSPPIHSLYPHPLSTNADTVVYGLVLEYKNQQDLSSLLEVLYVQILLLW